MSQRPPFALLPILEWGRSYRREWLGADVVAGLTTAAVVIPKAMAYATIAGLPVQAGLYTALVPLAIYAVLGTSRVLSVTTTTTLAILAAASLGEVVPGGEPELLLRAGVTLAFLVGVLLAAASLLRLGFVADFISEPVLVGFKAGIGLVIVLDQVPKLLGVHIGKGTFLQKVAMVVGAIPETSLPTLAVGAGTLGVLVLMERRLPRLPAPLVAVVAAIAAVALLDLPARGVAVVGEIPRGLPSLVLPDLSLAGSLWAGAMGIALMSFTETSAAARAFFRSGDPPIRPNQELLATGVANAAGALFGALPAGGGTSQTAVNRVAGAQTQLSGVVNAGATLLVMLFLAGPMGLLPSATLAAVVIAYSVGLVELAAFRKILQVRRMEFAWALVALVGVVALGTLKGIVVAIIVSMVALVQQSADPPVYEVARKRGTNVFRPRSADHPDDETFPGLLLVRIERTIFFANAARVGQKLVGLVEAASPRVVALDLRGVPDIEYTALMALVSAEERLRTNGVMLWLVGLTPGVVALVKRTPLWETLGPARLHFNLEQAVAAYAASGGARTAGVAAESR